MTRLHLVITQRLRFTYQKSYGTYLVIGFLFFREQHTVCTGQLNRICIYSQLSWHLELEIYNRISNKPLQQCHLAFNLSSSPIFQIWIGRTQLTLASMGIVYILFQLMKIFFMGKETILKAVKFNHIKILFREL